MSLLFIYFVVSIKLILARVQNPMVEISSGLVQGTWKSSANGRDYASFRGIPYAAPPLGEIRFQEPQPLERWSGVWNATEYAPPCIGYDVFQGKIVGQEDCLFLNVFTPKVNSSVRLPVLFFIPGGFFLSGSSNDYDPIFLMDKDIVVVTLNYRLGPFGFLSTGDDCVPGNAGLKDQGFALWWVQDNIELFGGDPNKVTLMGQGAGAASVHYHYLSPWSTGTFIRGIASSGTAFAPWAFSSKPAKKTRQLAYLVGCPHTNICEMTYCLNQVSALDLVKAQLEMVKVRLTSPFMPTTEGLDVENPFVPQHPYEATIKGQMQPLPLLLTSTSQDGLYPGAAYIENIKFLEKLDRNFNKYGSKAFLFDDTTPAHLSHYEADKFKAVVAEEIRQKYFDGHPINLMSFPSFVKALTDRFYRVGAGELAKLHAKLSRKPVYVSQFSYQRNFSLSMRLSRSNEKWGVAHADDTFYLFKGPGYGYSSENDVNMTNLLVNMVYKYATTGVPTISGMNWPPVSSKSDLIFFELRGPDEYGLNLSFDYGQKSFWNGLKFYENMNRYG